MGTKGYADITDETRCIGSGCMAWRWGNANPQQEALMRSQQPGAIEAATAMTQEGYCGLAGSP
jgi:hypothetical protein